MKAAPLAEFYHDVTACTSAELSALLPDGIFYPGASAYGIMKGAVDVFTRYLAAELGARGITANVVAPGAIFGGGAMTDAPEMRAFAAHTSALGRVGLPNDVAGVVAFLCTEEAE
ncbi:NAD(P)-dependent dehydrogenase (short-subunit alcohol dehydrogenase family) [Hymenobacter luteus]|uniref:NAD(P)-dependent dehydrogenase (Short-subunit alcohol dehydrogenase family) n=2 Tax=Hymenobacter TaxID=89966 RepID=A0A7W9WCX8_9BACT|nr:MULTISPECIES: SDR family oxidoreductase [Hymenobacter]MBB4602612.1 NAD(P)-dependent dehydrogenase (short-subunit alcohol dehydrogenase family) [Hymenobacter latericoloratus]MBB6060503.1 NAD(P)-dependent dehydrogenase (short-subunit alcohol dehydrogenase family) [Hymenobacter luteus]